MSVILCVSHISVVASLQSCKEDNEGHEDCTESYHKTFYFSPKKTTSQFSASLNRVQYIIHYIWNRQETNPTAVLPTQPYTCTPKICTQWLNIIVTVDVVTVMYRALMFPGINGTILQNSSPSCAIALRQDAPFFFFFAYMHSNRTLLFYGCNFWCSTVFISPVSAGINFRAAPIDVLQLITTSSLFADTMNRL